MPLRGVPGIKPPFVPGRKPPDGGAPCGFALPVCLLQVPLLKTAPRGDGSRRRGLWEGTRSKSRGRSPKGGWTPCEEGAPDSSFCRSSRRGEDTARRDCRPLHGELPAPERTGRHELRWLQLPVSGTCSPHPEPRLRTAPMGGWEPPGGIRGTLARCDGAQVPTGTLCIRAAGPAPQPPLLQADLDSPCCSSSLPLPPSLSPFLSHPLPPSSSSLF